MGLKLENILVGAISLLVGGFLTISGVGSALGVRLMTFGALTLFSTAFGNRSGRGGLKDSPRYGWDNLQNAGTEGGPIPVLYGEDRYAPPVVSVLPLQEGDTTTLYALYLLGHGEIEEVGDLELNDVPLDQFKGADYIAKLGTSTQSALWEKTLSNGTAVRFAGFNVIGRTFQAGTPLTKGAQHVHVMIQEADSLILSLVFPGGIFKVHSDGKREPWVNDLKIEYRLSSLSDSQYGPFSVPKNSAGAAQQGDWYAGSAAGMWHVWKRSDTTWRSTIRLDFPSRAKWAVRVTGTTNNGDRLILECTLATVTEVVNDARAYAGYALVGLKLPPSEQLQGGLPRFTLRFKGRKVIDPRVSMSARAYSANLALVTLDLLTDTTFGLGDKVPIAECDTGSGGTWRTWADECDALVTSRGAAAEKRYLWGGPLDSKAEASDWLGHMLGLGRAVIFQTQGLVRVGRDQLYLGSPRIFEGRASNTTNRRNLVAGAPEGGGAGPGESSLVVKCVPESSRPNVVRVSFMDSEDHYRRRIVEVKNRRIAIGAVTGTPTGGEEILGATSKAVARYVYHANGWLYYVTDDGASEFSAAEALTFKTSGASCSTSVGASAAWATTPLVEATVNAAGITRRTQAVRHARWMLNRALITPHMASWKIGPGDPDLEPADPVSVYDDDQGFAGKLFTVEAATRERDLVGDLIAREYDARVYADLVDQRPGVGKFLEPGGSVPTGSREPSDPKPASVTPATSATPVAAKSTTTVSVGASWSEYGLLR